MTGSVTPKSASSAVKAGSKGVALTEVRRHDGRDGSYWTAIYGTVYDISHFMTQHPGGSDVIRLAAGRDATCLFESYHPGSKIEKITKVLKTMKVVGPLVNDEPELPDLSPPSPYASLRKDDLFFRTCRDRVEAYLAQHKLGRYFYPIVALGEVFITVALYMFATYLVSWRGSFLGAIALGLLTGRIGFLMHCGNHAAVSSMPVMNSFAGWLMGIVGSSHVVWGHEHQIAHHCDPNEPGKDNDCTIGDPYLRFHPAVKPSFWQRYQHITTFIGITIGFFKWYVGDFSVFREGRVGSVRFSPTRKDWIILLMFKAQWLVLHVFIPWYMTGFARMMALLFLFMGVGAHYLENVFIVNHIQEECNNPPKDAHWATKQVITTVNWGSESHFWNWFSGGLNHQIEHHLFPSLSIYLYPFISPIVQQTCKEFDIPYRNYKTFPEAWMAVFNYLKALGADAKKLH